MMVDELSRVHEAGNAQVPRGDEGIHERYRVDVNKIDRASTEDSLNRVTPSGSNCRDLLHHSYGKTVMSFVYCETARR